MEIGFVKQALNNEIIKMKPLFRQAKVHTINNLTKKSKLFKAKLEKCDEKGVLKFSNKSKELLKEAFIIKKLKARDCAEFVLRNDKSIQHFLNSPEATREKALCRLITHKSLVDKIVFIKEKFLNMPIDVLLAPGKRQIFKEEKEKRKLQKKVKRPQEWTITNSPKSEDKKADDSSRNGNESAMETNNPEAEPSVPKASNSTPARPNKRPQPIVSKAIPKKLKKLPELKEQIIPQVSGVDSFFMTDDSVPKVSNSTPAQPKTETQTKESKMIPKKINKKLPGLKEEIKPQVPGVDSFFMTDVSVPKASNSTPAQSKKEPQTKESKLIPKKIKKKLPGLKEEIIPQVPGNDSFFMTDNSVPKASNSTPAQPKKKPHPKESKPIPKKIKKKLPELKEDIIPQVSGVDSFFMTDDGDNYQTLVEKRVQEPVSESKVVRGNRKVRRAAMFGRPLPFQPAQNSSKSERSFDKFEKNSKNWDNLPKRFDNATIAKKSRPFLKVDSTKPIKEDISSLHPSWQAKKQQSVISEFKGKKVVFEDD